MSKQTWDQQLVKKLVHKKNEDCRRYLREQRNDIVKYIKTNTNAYTGTGGEYNKGVADGYEQRCREVLDLLKNYV